MISLSGEIPHPSQVVGGKPYVVKADVLFNVGGNFTFNRETGGIGGKPSPSESEAHTFRQGVALLEHFIFMPYKEQQELLVKLGVK